jgi:prohibitin 1
MADKALGMIGKAGAVAAGAMAIPSFCLFNVDGGERAVMFNRFTVRNGN